MSRRTEATTRMKTSGRIAWREVMNERLKQTSSGGTVALALVILLAVATASRGAEETPQPTNAAPAASTNSVDEDVSTKWPTLAELKQAAEAGNTRAELELSAAYLTGLPNLPKDVPQGLNWMRKAADRGDNLGQYLLGDRLLRGDGVATNLAEAFDWFLKSARQNNPMAQMLVGSCYLYGQGVATNTAQGLRWLRMAADTGEPVCQFMLGLSY
jgi:TPR repeat protein